MAAAFAGGARLRPVGRHATASTRSTWWPTTPRCRCCVPPGLGVLSEESEFEAGATGEVVVIDPIDGSTNASRGLPWFATAMCVVDADGPVVGAGGEPGVGRPVLGRSRRGSVPQRRARSPRPGAPTSASRSSGSTACRRIRSATRQSRVYGAVALDLCMVACGVLDGYVDCDDRSPAGRARRVGLPRQRC